MRGTGPLLFTTPVLPISAEIGKADPLPAGPGERAHCRTRSLPCGHVAGRAGHPAAGAPCTAGGAAGGRVLDDPRPGADPAPARAHRRADDGHRRARRRAPCPCRTRCSGCACISLPARNATAAIAITYAGMGMLVLAWLWIGRMLRARGAVAPGPGPHPARAHRRCCGRCRSRWRRRCSPRTSTATSRRARSLRAASTRTSLGPAAALGVDDPLTRTIPTIWRDTPAAVRPAVPDARARHHRADRSTTWCSACSPHRVARALRRGADRLGAAPAGPPLRPRRRPRRSGSARRTRWCCSTWSAASTTRRLMIGLDARRARARRCAPSTEARGSCATRVRARRRGDRRWLPRSSCRRCSRWVPRDGRGPAAGRAACATSPWWPRCWPRSRSRSSPLLGVGTGLGLRLDADAGHRER